MPFPFLQPIQPWAREVFEEREKDRLSTMHKNPFVVISSGAKVVKAPKNIAAPKSEDRAKQIKELLETDSANPPPKDVWRGCVIANSIGTNVPGAKPSEIMDLTYSLGATPVGIDFDGKIIKVENETGRKVSMPIIESLEIDTDGANNTLKTARLAVRCFTLKQLEMFEMFFLKPGMNVLVEFGDNTLDIKKKLGSSSPKSPGQPITDKKKFNAFIDGKDIPVEPYSSLTQAFVSKKDYSTFCKDFSKYFRSDTSALAEYLVTIRNTLGSYDRVAGKVLDYSFSVNDDGTYSVNFEVSQGNQISFAIPANPTNSTSNQQSGTPKDIEFTTSDQVLTTLVADFNLEKASLEGLMNATKNETPNKTWEGDFFNFLKINREQKDTAASDTAYISLRFILTVLMNYHSVWKGSDNNPFFLLELPKFRKSPTDSEKDAITIIPVKSNKYLISSDPSVIFPREKLPTVKAPPKDAKDATEVFLDTGSFVKGIINNINFDTPHKSLFLPAESNSYTEVVAEGDLPFGDALNIFLDYKKVAGFWKRSYTRMDFLEKVLSMVNDNSYGEFQLIFGASHDNGRAIIMNTKYAPTDIQNQNKDVIYRFKPTTINSIVKQFSFDFQMSNLVAGMTIFNSRNVMKAAKEKKQPDNWKLPLPPQAYNAVDNSMFANADGWYSINQVEYENLVAVDAKIKEEEKKNITTDPPKNEEATKEAADLNEVIKNKSIKFIMNQNTKETELKTLVYTHKSFVANYIMKDQAKKSVVSPISVTLTIGGFSGLNCGEYFNVDGIPELYNSIGVFQITNIKHSVQPDGWSTTIEADHRIIDKPPAK